MSHLHYVTLRIKLISFYFTWNIRRMGISATRIKWVIKNVNKMTQWGNRITVIEQFPYFRGILRDPAWGKRTKRWTDFMDKSELTNVAFGNCYYYNSTALVKVGKMDVSPSDDLCATMGGE